MWIKGSAQTMIAFGHSCLIAFDAAMALLTSWSLNQPRCSGPTWGK
jgi:hypothetical protein